LSLHLRGFGGEGADHDRTGVSDGGKGHGSNASARSVVSAAYGAGDAIAVAVKPKEPNMAVTLSGIAECR
jgi:hypothetical protein